MIVKSLWTTIASTGAVSVALAATLSFNEVLTGGDGAPAGAASNGESAAYSGGAGQDSYPGFFPEDTLVGGVSLAAAAGVRVVVIDAGHGGRDHGCHGATPGVKEKTVALSMALALGERLRERHPEIQVVYTRDRDHFVPLYERARIANRAQADLFLSLHCNALTGAPEVRGSESYVMGLHTAQHNLDVAKRENAAIHLERDGAKTHYDFDPESPAGHITLSMFQHAFLEQSMALAADIETALGERSGRNSRGVKQAGFLVLKETAMPSVLVETGYLTNPREEAYLTGADGQAATVDALYRGVEQYMRHRAAGQQASPSENGGGRPILAAQLPNLEQRRLKMISEPDRRLEAHVATPSQSVKASGKTPSAHDRTTATRIASAASDPGTELYVQLSASARELNTSGSKWSRLGAPVRSVHEGGLFKYQAGPFSSMSAAGAAQVEARAHGFPDAFTTGYRDGSKLSRKALMALRS